MYADGSVYDNVDIENTSKELDHGLLHLSVSSYEEGYLTTYYFLFAVTHLTLAPQFLLFATFLAI